MQTVSLPTYSFKPPSRGQIADGDRGGRAQSETRPSGDDSSAPTARDLLGMSTTADEQPVMAVNAAGSAGLNVTLGLESSHDPTWKRIAHHVLHSAHLLLEGAEMAHVLTGAAVGGAVGATVISAGFTALGVSHVVEGVRNKSGEMVLEGAGALLIGVKSGLEAVAMSGEFGHGGLAHAAHVAHGYLAPLGVAHGAAEAALGAYGVYKGIQTKDAARITSGTLTLGLGASVCVASLGGGIPAVVTAGAFLAGRIIYEESQNFRAQTSGTIVHPSARGWRLLD